MCGSVFIGYSTYFYEAAGLADSNAFDFTMIQYALGLVGTLVAWILMAHFGRRTLYIAGLSILLVILVVIGGLGFTCSKSASWAVGSLLLVFTLAYDCTVGPVCYAIVADISSTRLRQKTVVLARATYNLCSILNNSLLPLQLNSLAWNWGAKGGLFWAGITLLCIIWCIFRLPESKGRTYAELNVLFEHQVATWKFQGTKVDAFRGEEIAVRRLSTTESSNLDQTLQAGERV
jgi:MFS transporter, SP family, general alpha glucoside:H+ symporter